MGADDDARGDVDRDGRGIDASGIDASDSGATDAAGTTAASATDASNAAGASNETGAAGEPHESSEARGSAAPSGPSDGLSRRAFLGTSASAAVGAAALGAAGRAGSTEPARVKASPTNADAAGAHASIAAHPLDEVAIADLSARMADGTLSAVEATQAYLDKIAAVDAAGPRLGSVIETNPDALSIAAERDRERAEAGPQGLGPLHGVPVLVKDNIGTADRMETTAGSLALVGARPAADSHVVGRLRAAGAVILGKANLSEWANFRGFNSSSGWSARGGLVKNPYSLDRTASGSSSGSAAAAAASLCAAAVGTETSGSIVSPASRCGLVGIKPTVGLISRSGIVPIADAFDTAGPMARSVRDAAILLGGMTGVDPADAKTAAGAEHAHTDYTQFLDPEGLRGATIGVARELFGSFAAQDDAMETAIVEMERSGATIVDDVALPNRRSVGGPAYQVMLWEFKALIATYLEGLGDATPHKTLADLIAFNEANADEELRYFGQEVFLAAEAKGPLSGQDYLDTLAQVQRLSRDEGLDAAFNDTGLDAIVAPMGGPAAALDLVYGEAGRGPWSGGLSASSGYPHITLPLTYIHGLPVAISFLGPAWSEPTLLRLAFAYEQAMQPRQAPALLASTTPPTPWTSRSDGSCAYMPIAGRDALVGGTGAAARAPTPADAPPAKQRPARWEDRH